MKIIHVNRQHIAMNSKDGKKVRYAREISILGPCKLVYNGKQLKCGARAWIETNSDILLKDEMTFREARLNENG